MILGFRNISNELSIGEKFEKSSQGLREFALEFGWWEPNTPFNFKQVFSTDPGRTQET